MKQERKLQEGHMKNELKLLKKEVRELRVEVAELKKRKEAKFSIN